MVSGLLQLECRSQFVFDNVVIMGEEQIDTLSNSKDAGFPNVLVRQKLYIFDHESSQASCMTKAKKIVVRQSKQVLSRPLNSIYDR